MNTTKYISKAEQFFGDYIAEYAEAYGEGIESICSGEYVPTKEQILDCMWMSLEAARVPEKQIKPTVEAWFRAEYGR